MITGSDVASYQAGWKPSKSDDFVFVKSVEGTSYSNSHRGAQLKAGRDAGLVVGHYAYIHHGNIAAQVAYFLKQTDIRDGEPIWCDWEAPGVTTADKDAWIKAVQKARPGNRVGLYCNTSMWKAETSGFYGDALWLAWYSSSEPSSSTWTFWQNSQTGKSNVGPIDTNRAKFNSRADLKAWAAGTAPAPKPTPTKATPVVLVPPIVIPTPKAKVPFRGGWTCTCVATSLPFVEQRMLKAGIIKHSVDIYQLGWRTDVDASAGTHAKGGNTDVAQFSDAALKVWRECGWGMQHRTRAQGFDADHGHGFPIGCTHLSAGGQAQQVSYLHGRDGLRQNGPITGPKVPIITWSDAIRKYNATLTPLGAGGGSGTHPQEEPVPEIIPTVKHSPKLKLTPGKYAWLPLNAKGDLSFADGPGLFDVLAQVTVDELPLGGAVTVEIVCYDRIKVDGKWTTKPIGVIGKNDLNANGGRANGQVFAHRKVGPTDTKGAIRVYRVRAFASHPCVVTDLVVDASITKI